MDEILDRITRECRYALRDDAEIFTEWGRLKWFIEAWKKNEEAAVIYGPGDKHPAAKELMRLAPTVEKCWNVVREKTESVFFDCLAKAVFQSLIDRTLKELGETLTCDDWLKNMRSYLPPPKE